ncbi:FAD-dependent monooxygenase [Mycolicibacterium sp. YH-1]|uniref:FAD-dependent monooxygenase n=1 Tax=Mycolicibacterium sp. YH-1 TaxID=2908837 RepID=UPI001F4BD84F|nr:FAD-dependent monooxygenase [Mycolicibacterium sp. YH-1]UNB54542.1 FAD-dependent monooxygenase [Mycolicibacterium sp. YH-1]
MNVIHTDVLVVGAGPAGLTASALLARQGVQAITVCKYQSTAHSPRAHITNQRTMEVMRDLGIEERVYQEGAKMQDVPDIIWTTSLADRELSRRRAWGTRVDRKGDYEQSSPCSTVNVGQSYLEPVILYRALDLGADIRFNTEFIELAQDTDGVTATVRDRHTGHQHQIRARYLLGADGGRSLVAEQAGVEFDGQGKLGNAVNVHIEADLTHLVAHRPATLYWTNFPGREYVFGSGSFVLVKEWNEWAVQFSYDPASDFLAPTEEALLPRIHTAIGDPDVQVRIKGFSAWELQDLVARQYRKDRILIAGDAAHRHNPSNGLGSNTSIQDSYNLAWKLAAVVQGHADDALLDTYQSERQPVGQQIVNRATSSIPFVASVSTMVGIQAGQSEEQGWAAIDTFLSPGPEGRKRRDELLKSFAQWDYGINAHGVEMGQRYTSTAVCDDGTPMPAYDKDEQLFYQPTTHPGAYLPHVWLTHDDRPVSTLDLVPADTWTVITGIDGQRWLDAAEILSKEFGFDIAATAVGLGLPYADAYGDWAAIRDITDGGCLLVRPDKYIAWRQTDLTEDPSSDLRRVFQQILR